MDRLTNNSQEIDLIKKIVCKAFNNLEISLKADSVNELTEGCYNSAYNIILENDLEVILKVSPKPKSKVLFYEGNIMNTEVTALKLVKNNTTVPVPKIYFYDTSKAICSSDYFFMEKIPGCTLLSLQDTLLDDEKNKILFELGVFHKEINSLTGTYYGYPGRKELQGKTWPEAFMKMFNSLLSDGKTNNVNIGISYEGIYEIVKNNLYCLNDITKPHLVHWDLWDGNIFIEDSKISGIIDFERALWGDPLMEYYFNEIPDNKVPKSFLDGYGICHFTANEVRKRILYNIYLYLIMTIECSYRKYPDDTQYEYGKVMLKQQLNLLGELY